MAIKKIIIAGLCFLCISTCTGISSAEDEDGYVVSIQFENDFFGGGTDRHFTHGTRLQYLSKPIQWITDAADKVPWFSVEKALKHPEDALKARASVSLGQNIYSPENIALSELIPDDRPYAGW
ncbi:MAG: DUF2219 family protein, partial [Deltaproteobacteria bacterium]|nr:DUF2219 family protein [Deltaproteobacteria bacterium]